MDLGERSGNRAVGIGEVPYFDPESISKAEWLRRKKAEANGAGNGTTKEAPSETTDAPPNEGHVMVMGSSKVAMGSPCIVKGVQEMAH
jgi:hypothetical protein